MKVIKSINNNVANCTDSMGREVIVFGKGVGFFKAGEEIPLDRINRTFYNIKDTDFGVLREIPTEVINTSIYIIDYASEKLNVIFPSSSAVSLADHLQFAITRKDQNIYLELPLIHDLRQLYPEEMRIADESLKIIEKMTGEKLPRIEAGTIAMHFINDRIQPDTRKTVNTEKIIDDCTEIIEKQFSLKIDRESFNYSRFVTHLDYLIRRLMNNEQIQSQNLEVFEQLSKQYPQSVECATKVGSYLKKQFGIAPTDEEILYLVVHINRMISRI